jgi:hypothetical protein
VRECDHVMHHATTATLSLSAAAWPSASAPPPHPNLPPPPTPPPAPAPSFPPQAKAEGIVAYVSNLWDTCFEGGRDHRLERPSVTALPYFEGDYWPGEAENLLACLGEEARQDGAKGKTRGAPGAGDGGGGMERRRA